MDDALFVGLAEAGEHLEHDGKGELGIGAEPILDGPLEVQALQELEGHERQPLVFAELVDHHDVRVLESRYRLSLALEPRQGPGIGRDPRGHHLHRDHPVQRLVNGAVDDPHRPPAEEARHAVAADPVGESHVGGMIGAIMASDELRTDRPEKGAAGSLIDNAGGHPASL